WMQSFSEDVQGYAYDFSDMTFVMQDCARLMSQWRTRYQDTIHEVKYEQLVASPSHVIADLAGALGLAPQSSDQLALPATPGEISSASLWQARQPIYARSLEKLHPVPARASGISGVRTRPRHRSAGLEQQIGRQNVFVTRDRGKSPVLVHPVGWEHQQPPLPWPHLDAETAEFGFTTLRDIIEVPEANQIAIRHLSDRIEVQLEALTRTGLVALDPQRRQQLGCRDGYGQPHIRVVPRQVFVDLAVEESLQGLIGERRDVEFGPRTGVESLTPAPLALDMVINRALKRTDQLLAERGGKRVVVPAHVVPQCSARCRRGELRHGSPSAAWRVSTHAGLARNTPCSAANVRSSLHRPAAPLERSSECRYSPCVSRAR